MSRFLTKLFSAVGLSLAVALQSFAISPTFADDLSIQAKPRQTIKQGNQGLHGGWAIDDSGNTVFTRSLTTQYGLIQEAGAGWVRVNFRLGGCYQNVPYWTTTGCNGKTALQVYDDVVNQAQAKNLRVLGVLSNESWHGDQAQWTQNAAELTTAGNGSNPYIEAFSNNAAGVLAGHFKGRVDAWQVWNEPNAWTYLDASGNPQGSTFIYPSNFAQMLSQSHTAIKRANASATVVAGGVFGHDIGGATMSIMENGRPRQVTKRGELMGAAQRPSSPPASGPSGSSGASTSGATTTSTVTCQSTVKSGADYLCATYERGIAKAGWTAGAYPFDQVAQHLYIDQGGATSSQKIADYLADVRNAYVAFEGSATGKRTHVTEVGWSTGSVSARVQANNLDTAFKRFRATTYVERAYWFNVQDIPEANLHYGLTDARGTKKTAFSTYQSQATY